MPAPAPTSDTPCEYLEPPKEHAPAESAGEGGKRTWSCRTCGAELTSQGPGRGFEVVHDKRYLLRDRRLAQTP